MPIELDQIGFERLLNDLCSRLGAEARNQLFQTSRTFETSVRSTLQDLLKGQFEVDFNPHPYLFPDIVVDRFGIEVKFTTNDTWRSVANSVFETFRSKDVRHIYVVFGKMGGDPDVRWGRYEDSVIHVRTSHVPRFELEIQDPAEDARQPLFAVFGITYEQFCQLPPHDRMQYIRRYARNRLKKGQRLWWLDDRPDEGHALPMEARLYTSLTQSEKRQYRAEAALLCPQVVRSSRAKGKYDDATLYLLTYRGVLCNQARDLFSAGSVAGPERGGNYLMRALKDIEREMLEAAAYLEDALFQEYWGQVVPPQLRVSEWLRRADEYAREWKPSAALFQTVTREMQGP